MKTYLLLFLALSTMPFLAESAYHGKRANRVEAGSPWMGIHVTWMEKSTAAQLREVPAGFGLLIDIVEPISPANTANLQSLDVIWKYDDQLIASKRQLNSLIVRTGIGNEATLTVSRAGENIVLPIVIGKRPENLQELEANANEVLLPPLPGVFVREVDRGKLTGFIEEGGVTVSLSRKKDGYFFAISEGDKVIKEGLLEGDDNPEWPVTLDEKVRRKLESLRNGLADAENREAQAPRLPRVRRVIPPSKNAKK